MSGKRCMGCMNEQKTQYTVCPYCGLKAETAPDPSQIRPGTVLAQRYEVGFALKIGLYTITYIAYDLQREEKVIVKEYYPSQLCSRVDGGNRIGIRAGGEQKTFYERGLTQFLKEAKDLHSVSVPFLIPVQDVFTENAMLFVNSTQFGIGDPIFSLDIGYFIFQKPFIEMILMLLISITICVLIYSVIYYIVTFNVCFDGIDRNTLKQSNLVNKIFKYIKIVVVFLGVYIIFKTQDLGIDQSVTLQDDDSTRIYGAGLTSVTIKLWGYIIFAILMVVAVFKAIKFFKEKKTRKVVISLVTIPGYLLALFLVMTIFQFAFVKPNELDREKQYIEANIRNTRTAYNINVYYMQFLYF